MRSALGEGNATSGTHKSLVNREKSGGGRTVAHGATRLCGCSGGGYRRGSCASGSGCYCRCGCSYGGRSRALRSGSSPAYGRAIRSSGDCHVGRPDCAVTFGDKWGCDALWSCVNTGGGCRNPPVWSYGGGPRWTPSGSPPRTSTHC